MRKFKTNNDYLVIGVGKFGLSVIQSLLAAKKTVVAVDRDEERIAQITDDVDYAAVLDATVRNNLEELGTRNMRSVVIAIEDLEKSVLVAVLLLECGVQSIFARAGSERHGKILSALGIKNIIYPEIESGKQAAIKVLFNFEHEINYFSEHHSFIKLIVNQPYVVGKKIAELNLRSKFTCNIVLIQRDGAYHIPHFDEQIMLNDILVLIIRNSQINDFIRYWNLLRN